MSAFAGNNIAIENKVIHAGLAGGVALLAILIIASVAIALARFGSDKVRALTRASEQIAAYSLRLDEQRTETIETLERLGATPTDLETLSTAETAKALVSENCNKLAAELGGSCEFVETPVNDLLSFHQARFVATGEPTAMTNRLVQAIAAPLRIRALSLNHVGSSNEVELSALIEAVGARTVSEAP